MSDYDAIEKIILAIGMDLKKGCPLTKYRVSYLLNNVHFEIDTLSQFPSYLEIESPTRDPMYEYAEKLGFKTSDVKPWGTREIFAHYRKI